MEHRRCLIILLLSGIALPGCNKKAASDSTNPPPAGEVPQAFSAVYQDLSTTLDQFSTYLDTLPGRRQFVTFGAELTAANSHRGPGLLAANAYDGVLLYMNRLKDLGVGGVSVTMDYPLLNDSYPRSAEYWAFYQRLAGDVRRAGLKLHVKSGPIFNDTQFSNVPVDYSNVSVDDYFRDRGRIAQRIAHDIKPDYLTFGNEPSTEMQIFRFTITSDRYTRFISDTLAGMDRAGILVGAGSGTWDSTDYVQRFASGTSLDYIDLHVYPLASGATDYLRRAVEMADIAYGARKRIIIGEAWLYKGSRLEISSNPTAPAIFGRDPFSFWSPLDVKFLGTLAKMASIEGIEYMSPFWTKYFFSYLDYDNSTANAPAQQLQSLADQAALRQLLAGAYSSTGNGYSQVIRQNR